MMVLVTGGAGFIGSHLVQCLIEEGQLVRVLDLPSANYDHLSSGVDIVRGDIRDVICVRRAVKGCDEIYHLAGNPNLWARDRREFDSVNRIGTLNVLREALEAGARRVLYVSTESILISKDKSATTTESFRPRRDDMVGAYCLSKFRAEQVAWELAESGAPVLIATPTIPVGPGDRNMTPPTRLTLAAARGSLPVYLDARLNMIDVRDVALGLRQVVQFGVTKKRYLLGAWNIQIGQWLAMVAREAGICRPRFEVPYPLALLLAVVDEWAAMIFNRTMPLASVTGVRLTRFNMNVDATATQRELGLQPRPLAESLADTIAWYQAQSWI
jgi:dihydroflavonol-4-reductase